MKNIGKNTLRFESLTLRHFPVTGSTKTSDETPVLTGVMCFAVQWRLCKPLSRAADQTHAGVADYLERAQRGPKLVPMRERVA